MAADERAAVEQVVRDYFESWFDGDPDRMRRALHPQLAKRHIADDGQELRDVPSADLVEATATGPRPEVGRTLDVRVLDVGPDLATVHVVSEPFYEYLHLGRFAGDWLIVNSFFRSSE